MSSFVRTEICFLYALIRTQQVLVDLFIYLFCLIYSSLSVLCVLSSGFPRSGLIVPEIRGNETVPEVETTSGYALLHFFSDAAYNLTGFEIFYS